MLGHKDAVATVAVKSTHAAKQFYEGVLGLTQNGSGGPGWVSFKSGNTALFAYESQYAGTNQATCVTWALGADFDAILQALQAKGIVFEHYDLPNMTRQGDVHSNGDMKVAWFKDPDGNILNIGNG